jgi:soluble lytic murein transglycosylase-like protein
MKAYKNFSFLRACQAAVVTCALLAAPLAEASIYIYRGPSGERLVTNIPMTGNGYKLLHEQSTMQNVGHLAAGRKGPTAADAPLFSIASGKPYKRKWVNSSEYDAYIREAALRHGVEPALVKAVIQVESNFDPEAVSRAGARGLMQLMPGTAAMYQVGMGEIYKPSRNIEAGVKHLAYLKTLFPNSMDLVLAAYNAGENNVLKYNGIPPFPETRDYVAKVKYSHNIFKRVFL